jgi:hypothetical protein
MDSDVEPFEFARVYAQWGKTDEAMKWLASAVTTEDPNLLILKVDWMLGPIRNEPEFMALERRMNFPP